MGYWAGNYLKSVGRDSEEINAVVLEGTTGATAATERTNGINEALKNFPNIKIVASQTGNFTRAEGQAVMESFLKSQPDIDMLFAETTTWVWAPSPPSRPLARSRARTSSSSAATP